MKISAENNLKGSNLLPFHPKPHFNTPQPMSSKGDKPRNKLGFMIPLENEVTKLNTLVFLAILTDNICSAFHICTRTIHPVPVQFPEHKYKLWDKRITMACDLTKKSDLHSK